METELLPYGARIDLTNCDREPIHVPGHIQGHGALLVMRREESVVVQVSDNLAQVLGIEAHLALGKELSELLGVEPAEAVKAMLADRSAELRDNPRSVYQGPVGHAPAVELVVHERHGYVLIECEIASVLDSERGLLEGLRYRLRTMRAGTSLSQYCDRLSRELRSLTGYDRVMVYRFAEDWHGWVFAESKRDDLAPFLDLHYPASDIPAQARALFLVNGTRLLVDARHPRVGLIPDLLPDNTATDMSYSFLRGASQMYTEYLNNMGVRATLTMAIPNNGKLWGLIACHHYDGPRHLGYGTRTACDVLASTASLHIRDLVERESRRENRRLEQQTQAFVAKLASQEDLSTVLREHCAELKAILPCDGFCVCLPGSDMVAVGAVPSLAARRRMLTHLMQQRPGAVYMTDYVGGVLPTLAEESDTCAGTLAVPVAHAEGAWLVWFRGEQLRSVNWAGDPHKPVELGEFGERLTPRKSFELWSEIVRGRSEPWSAAEREAANTLRISLGDVLYRERTRLQVLTQQLEARNRDLDHFNAVASHDLREPLRAIANYARFLEDDLAANLDAESAVNLRRIRHLVNRMYGLIEGLLSFSRAGSQPLQIRSVDLNTVARNVRDDLFERIQGSGGSVTIKPDLPTIVTWELGVTEILANLTSNALKYADNVPTVEVGQCEDRSLWRADVPDDAVVLYVRDEGIGIAPEHHDSVFKIFQRLHSDPKYGEGSGTGLPLVRRLAERLGGRVWIESNPPRRGATFFVALRDMRGVES